MREPSAPWPGVRRIDHEVAAGRAHGGLHALATLAIVATVVWVAAPLGVLALVPGRSAAAVAVVAVPVASQFGFTVWIARICRRAANTPRHHDDRADEAPVVLRDLGVVTGRLAILAVTGLAVAVCAAVESAAMPGFARVGYIVSVVVLVARPSTVFAFARATEWMIARTTA